MNNSTISTNGTNTHLPLVMCILLNLPENRVECSNEEDEFQRNCISCPLAGMFLTGEGMDDYFGISHIISFVLGGITVIIGTCGFFMTIVIITVLKRQNSGRSFDILLMALAGFDLVASFLAVSCAASMIVYFQNWSRNGITVAVYLGGLLGAMCAKSGSSFLTVAITTERYLCVAFPFSTSNWFTPQKTKIVAVGIAIFAFCMAIPRFSSLYLWKNTISGGIASIEDLDYLIYSSPLEKFWYYDLNGFFDQIDFWLPLPLLLVFNGLVFYYVWKFSARRKQLNRKQRKDLRAGQMFIPVVIVLFICNIEPIIHYFYINIKMTCYREGVHGLMLSLAINSAANLPIYYLKGSSFRKEARILISSWFPCFTKCCTNSGEKKNTSASSHQSKSRGDDEKYY